MFQIVKFGISPHTGLFDIKFWTSGRRIDGTLYWFESGEKLNFTNWGENEPNNAYGTEDCIGLSENVQLKWNDFNCDKQLNIICEDDKIQYAPLAPASIPYFNNDYY